MDETDHQRWWTRFSQTLAEEARDRGGRAYLLEWAVNLAPPDGRGTFFHVTQNDHGFATVECGFALKTTAKYVDVESDGLSALSVVRAVMDGRAWEYADASADGTWVGTRFFIELPDGSDGDRTPRHRPGRQPVTQSFARRLLAWGEEPDGPPVSADEDEPADPPPAAGGLQFLSLEEAVRRGITDADGNFRD